MCGRWPAPSVVAVIDDEPTQRRGSPGAAVAGLVVALIAVTLLVGRLFGLFDLDPPDIDPPRWLRWIGPVFGVGKLLFLVGLGLLAVLGEWERRRRRDGGPS
jgi:hypothetical protein